MHGTQNGSVKWCSKTEQMKLIFIPKHYRVQRTSIHVIFSVCCLHVCLVSSWAIKSTFPSLFPTSTLYKHRRWKSLTGAAHSWVGKGMHPGKWPSCLWRRAEEIELSWKFCHGTQCGKRRRRHTFISTYWDVIMQHWDDGLKRRRNCGAKFNACNYVFYETLQSLTSFFRVFTLCDMGTPFF